MKTLLQIRSSIFSNDGQSSRLAERFVARWSASNPGGKVIVRDLAKEPVPHLDAARFGAFLAKPVERTPAQQAVVDYSDALIGELKRADVVVLGLPMYNFGVPSTLKAYFDHVARVGETFKYTEKGPVGLLTGNPHFPFLPRHERHRVRLRRGARDQRGEQAAQPRARGGRDRCAGGARTRRGVTLADSYAQVNASGASSISAICSFSSRMRSCQ